MKSVPKLIRRFVSIMVLSFILLMILNLSLLAVYTLNQMPNSQPWTTAQEVADHLQQNKKGYFLPKSTAFALKESDIWAIFIDNQTLQVVWQTDNVPKTIPVSYSVSDIANLTRGYIHDYPTFTGECKDGLAVLGYPKGSFWKHMWPSWDYNLILNIPKAICCFFAINLTLIFIIYITANTRLLKSVKPIVDGIQALPLKEAVFVKEKGILSELAVSINKTSEILQSQNEQLRKKETARANWIAGVSHDIRTPLSIVMGYAGQMENDKQLSEDNRKKSSVIVKQSDRMRNLINDLNLASKLEYNMQPIHLAKQNVVALVRQVAVDFINMDIHDYYPIKWETEESFTICPVNADHDLIKRAIGNLIQNCMNHNQGCNIYVSVAAGHGKCIITVADDGVGATDEQIEQLNHAPHYMVCDENISEQRHGLGLLIVRQIIDAHGGTTKIMHSPYGGFSVKLILPILETV